MKRLILVLVLIPLLVHAAPDQRRRTTFAQDIGTTCTFRPGFTQCSDGRTITTTRASAVPCETAPGVWTYAPAGTACVSVRGLESWGANTTLVPDGAQPDDWTKATGITVEMSPSGGWRITRTSSGGFANVSTDILGADSTRTSACILRNTNLPSLGVYRHNGTSPVCSVTPGAEWGTFSCGGTVAAGWRQVAGVFLSDTGYVDAIGCWGVEGSTPGRPCWAEDGTAPFACEADVHTISTEGFPTDEGSITLSVTWGEDEARQRGLIDGLTIETNGALKQGSVTSSALAWTVGQTYRVEMRRDGGTVSLHRDGVQVASGASAAWTWGATATLGGNGATALNGGIGMLRFK